MSRNLTTSIALGALLAGFGLTAMAQDAATPPAATPPAAATPATTVTLPKVLQDAGLTDVTSDQMRRGGTRIQGTLPDGQKIGAMLAQDGSLRGIRMQDDSATLPQALVDQLVPQAVRDNAVFAQVGKPAAVFTDERGVMVAGKDAQGAKVRAAFAQDGTLIRFGRGDDDMRFGKDGKDGKGWGKDRDGKRSHHGRKGDHDDDRDGRRGPPPGDMPPPPAEQGALPPPPADGAMRQGAADLAVDPAEVRMALTSAGYSDIGQISQDGPRILALAVNPEGEPVALELDPQGEVMREINR